MSLITQCPACSTMFKVVPDQLRVSNGWVRCGQCDEVFDANAHMRILSPESIQESAAVPAPDLAQNPAAESGEYDWRGVVEVQPANPKLQSGPVKDAFLEKSPQELVVSPPAEVHARPASISEAPLSVYPQDIRTNGDIPDTSAGPSSYSTPLSFMDSKKPVARGRTRLGTALWLVAMLLLVVAITLQLVLMERDRLAAAQPALKPALVAVCEVLTCKVSPLKQIESIVIDSSTFSKVQPDVYKLSVILKNNAAVEVAKPFIELTLTDSQDQALVRKVISPADLGDKGAVIAQADEVSWTIPISVKQVQGARPIAGYRVVAFYP